MFKYTLDYINLIHLSKVTVNEKKLKITYYFDGRIETQTFADSSEFEEAVAAVEDAGFLLIGETYYNKDRLSIVAPNVKNITFNFVGNVVITHTYEDTSEVEDVIGQIEEGFIFINGKWYQGKQIHVAMSDPIALTVKYDFLGMDMFPVTYEDQAAFDEALEKLAVIAEGGQGGGTPKVKTPKILPAGGEVEKGTEVTITCATEDATIHYTIDGSTPTAESPVYSSPITINATTTVKAMATKTDMKNSSVATVKYIINIPSVAKPVLAPAAGEVELGTEVTITCATDGATIHYTTDGTAPTTDSPVYSDPIVINTTTTVKAFAVKEDMQDSQVASAEYIITVPTVAKPTFSPAAGAVASGTEVTISCATAGATIHYTTDGSTPTTDSPVYTDPIVISTATTLKAFAVKNAMADSAVNTAAYTIKLFKYAGVFNNPDEDTDVIPPATDMTLEWMENLVDLYTDDANAKNLGGMGDEHRFEGISEDFGGRVVYAYPASLGDLTSYIQNSSTQAITNSFTKLTNTVAGVLYNIYILTDASANAWLPYAFV